MDIISAYREAGSYRGAAAISGTTPKTVRRVIARHEAGGSAPARSPREHNYDVVATLVAERVAKTAARIVPAERLVIERELLAGLPSLRASIGRLVTRKAGRLSCVRFGSARYSVPVALIGTQVGVRTDDGRLLVIMTGTGQVAAGHILVAPGEASVLDDHYGGPRPSPRRAVRPKTAAEKAFCALGPVAEAFITGAAAAGHTRLGPELAELNTLRAAHGEEVFRAALGRAVAFGRWRAADVRSILAAGPGAANPRAAGDALVLELPVVPVRPLSDYAIGGLW
jgi:hypothetical protein